MRSNRSAIPIKQNSLEVLASRELKIISHNPMQRATKESHK